MPIENERKYILSLTPDSIDNLIKEYDGEHVCIRQGYVGEIRVRAIRHPLSNLEQYMFTWKKRRDDGSRIEIETKLIDSDFNKLWKMATKIIHKQRIKIKGYGVTWDVDFLFGRSFGGLYIDDSFYLTIAEVEMPEGMDEPNAIPDFVTDNLLYLVPRDEDKLWTNKNLSNPKKVKKMLDNALRDKKA